VAVLERFQIERNHQISPWPPPEAATQTPRVCAANDVISNDTILTCLAKFIGLADARQLGGRVKPGHGEERELHQLNLKAL
jgi:hypothetical protein